jgi:RNA polymerase sigma-70 factor (ECF subfamily)
MNPAALAPKSVAGDSRQDGTPSCSPDTAAREKLVRENYPSVYRFAIRFTGNRHDAENLTQETFVSALKQLHRIQFTRPPLSWLLGIAYRQCVRAFREASKFPTEPIDFDCVAPGLSPADALEATDTLARLNDAARRELTAREYAVYRLSVYESMSPSDMAEVIGGSALAARMTLHRVRTWIEGWRNSE